MHVLRRRLILLASIFLSIISVLGSSDPVMGQSTGGFTPSADQIEMFKNLTPEQQQAIVESLGGGASGGSGSLGALSGLGSSLSTSSGSRTGLSTGLLDNATNRRPSDQDEEREPAIPILRGDDWVIVEIDFHLGPRPLPSSATALNGATGQQLPSAQNIQAYQAAVAAQSGNIPPETSSPTPGAPGVNAPPGFSSLVQPSDNPYAPEQLTEKDIKRIRDLMDLIRSRNPYQLTHDGALILPGFAEIPLAGLTDDQASQKSSQSK